MNNKTQIPQNGGINNFQQGLNMGNNFQGNLNINTNVGNMNLIISKIIWICLILVIWIIIIISEKKEIKNNNIK